LKQWNIPSSVSRTKLSGFYGMALISIIVLLLTISTASAVSNLTVEPDPTYVGDEITITGYGNPDSVILACTSYTVNISVEEGIYEYELKNVKVPEGTDTFSVEAENVTNLEVAVKKFGIPFSRTVDAHNGFAEITQSGVPPFTYKVTISGQSEKENINLTLKGESKIRTDENGYFECSYKTNTVPAGPFTVEIEGDTYDVLLLERSEQGEERRRSGGSNTGTELRIISAEELAARNTATDENTQMESEEENPLQAPPENVTTSDEETPTAEQEEPQPAALQRIINWLLSFFS